MQLPSTIPEVNRQLRRSLLAALARFFVLVACAGLLGRWDVETLRLWAALLLTVELVAASLLWGLLRLRIKD